MSSLLAALVVKTEQAENVFVVDMEGTFFGDHNEKVPMFLLRHPQVRRAQYPHCFVMSMLSMWH